MHVVFWHPPSFTATLWLWPSKCSWAAPFAVHLSRCTASVLTHVLFQLFLYSKDSDSPLIPAQWKWHSESSILQAKCSSHFSFLCLPTPDFSLPPRFAHFVSPLGLCLSSYSNLLTSRLLWETSVKCCVLKRKGSHPLDLSLGNDDSLLWNPCKLPLSYRSSHPFYSLHMSGFSRQEWLCINHCILTHIGDYN